MRTVFYSAMALVLSATTAQARDGYNQVSGIKTSYGTLKARDFSYEPPKPAVEDAKVQPPNESRAMNIAQDIQNIASAVTAKLAADSPKQKLGCFNIEGSCTGPVAVVATQEDSDEPILLGAAIPAPEVIQGTPLSYTPPRAEGSIPIGLTGSSTSHAMGSASYNITAALNRSPAEETKAAEAAPRFKTGLGTTSDSHAAGGYKTALVAETLRIAAAKAKEEEERRLARNQNLEDPVMLGAVNDLSSKDDVRMGAAPINYKEIICPYGTYCQEVERTAGTGY